MCHIISHIFGIPAFCPPTMSLGSLGHQCRIHFLHRGPQEPPRRFHAIYLRKQGKFPADDTEKNVSNAPPPPQSGEGGKSSDFFSVEKGVFF